jgi:hypothetical protein
MPGEVFQDQTRIRPLSKIRGLDISGLFFYAETVSHNAFLISGGI